MRDDKAGGRSGRPKPSRPKPKRPARPDRRRGRIGRERPGTADAAGRSIQDSTNRLTNGRVPAGLPQDGDWHIYPLLRGLLGGSGRPAARLVAAHLPVPYSQERHRALLRLERFPTDQEIIAFAKVLEVDPGGLLVRWMVYFAMIGGRKSEQEHGGQQKAQEETQGGERES